MRNLKKVLSLVLCIVMMMSVMVVGAGAAFTDQDKIVNTDAVEYATALGILAGYEDGSFRPANNITRAEATKLIAYVMNGKEPALVNPNSSSYTDVLTSNNSKWANAVIEYCTAAKVVAGMGNGTFAPDSNVTASQLAKMLLVVLGNDPVAQGYLGSAWELNVNVDATKAGLYNSLKDIDLSAPLTRDQAVQMIWNALNATIVSGMDKGNNMLNTVFNAYVDNGINKGTTTYNFDTGVYTYKIGADKYTSTEAYADLFAQNVNVLVQDGDIIAMTLAKGGVVYEGNIVDVPADINFDNNAVKVPKNIKVVAFNQYADKNYEIDDEDIYFGVRAIDQDGGGDIDIIVVYPYSVLKVVDVDNTSVKVRPLSENDGKLYAEADGSGLGEIGKFSTKASVTQPYKAYADVIGTLERYGYAIGVAADNTLKHLNTLIDLDAKTGKISSLSTEDMDVTFAGDATYYADILSCDDGVNVFKCLSVKYEYTYVAVNGFLFMVNGAGVQAQANYAVVTANSANTTGTTAKVWQTEILLPDGTTKTIESNAKRVVGRMFTYDIDNAGVYVMTPVAAATLDTDDCIYDVQEVASNTLNANTTAADLAVDKDKVGVYVEGDAKYYVTDDTIVYAYNTEDDTYEVITAAELKANLGDNLQGAAVVAANKAANGFCEAQIVYVAFQHDIHEVIQTAYILGVERVAQDANGDFYVVVKVMLPGGEVKSIESKHVDLYEDAELLQALYRDLTGEVYDLRLLDGQIVHPGEEVELTEVIVDATYDGKQAFTGKDGITYVITSDTKVFDLDGKGVNDLTADDVANGDTVKLVAGDEKNGTKTVEIIVIED